MGFVRDHLFEVVGVFFKNEEEVKVEYSGK
jgi:hypothetical protein